MLGAPGTLNQSIERVVSFFPTVKDTPQEIKPIFFNYSAAMLPRHKVPKWLVGIIWYQHWKGFLSTREGEN